MAFLSTMAARLLLCFSALVAFFGLNNGSAPQHDRRVVCYLASWSIYLPEGGKFEVSDAQAAASHCTHIVLLFTSLDEASLEMTAGEATHALIDQGGISKALQLKEAAPHLKIMVGLGGWNDGSVRYSRMARDRVARAKFVTSVEAFLMKYKLDGVDVNWQFPGDRGGAKDDKANLVSLIKELRTALDKRQLILSVAVSAFPWRIDLGTDGKGLSEHAHFLNVLSYEYHAKWDNIVGPSTPLYSNNDFSLNDTIHRYLNMGVDPSKINLGLSAYGTTYNLVDPTIPNTEVVGSLVSDGYNGRYNDVVGFIAYNELCLDMAEGGWSEIWDQRSYTPFARKVVKVASFDNAESYNAKIKLAVEKRLGGVIFYGLEKDDFKGACASSNGSYPLLRAITGSILKYTTYKFDEIVNLLKVKNAHYFWNGMRD